MNNLVINRVWYIFTLLIDAFSLLLSRNLKVLTVVVKKNVTI